MLCWTTFALFVAIILYELYRRRKLRQEKDLALVCHLAKFPDDGDNENLCMELMSKNLFSPNALRQPNTKWTPFLSACFGGSLRLIQLMLDNGADKMQKSAEGDGAVYVAVYGIISRLEGATNFARSREVQLGILIIDSLVHCGCDIDATNQFGYTPLHWAAAMGETWLVDHLLKKGANPCHKTKLSGALPSTFASECNHLRVQLMLERAEITYRSY